MEQKRCEELTWEGRSRNLGAWDVRIERLRVGISTMC